MTRQRLGTAREHGRLEVPRGAFRLAPGLAGPGALPVADAVELVIADWQRQAAAGSISRLTAEKFAPGLRRFAKFAAAYGAASLADVDADLCRRWCTALKSTGVRADYPGRGEPTALGTSHNRKGILRGFFVTCQALGLDDRDPSLSVALPARPTTRWWRPLTDTEAVECRRVAHRAVGETLFPASVGLALSGVTTAEMAAIRVQDCFPDHGRLWAHGGGVRTSARWVELEPWAAAAIAARVEHHAARTNANVLPGTLLVYSPRDPATPPQKRQSAVAMQLANVLRLAGLGSDPGLRPGAFVEHAAVRIFARTGSLPATAAALGMPSLDSLADLMRHDWLSPHRIVGPPGVADPATPLSYAGVAHPGTGTEPTSDAL